MHSISKIKKQIKHTETYEVKSDTLTIPQLNSSYDAGEQYVDDNTNQEVKNTGFSEKYYKLIDILTSRKNVSYSGKSLVLNTNCSPLQL